MILTLEEKIQIYNEWKIEHKSSRFLAIKCHLNYKFVTYTVRLADRYGGGRNCSGCFFAVI